MAILSIQDLENHEPLKINYDVIESVKRYGSSFEEAAEDASEDWGKKPYTIRKHYFFDRLHIYTSGHATRLIDSGEILDHLKKRYTHPESPDCVGPMIGAQGAIEFIDSRFGHLYN